MPLCQQVKKETENFTNALEVENNILRPRATERERLLKENKALKEEMEKVQSDNNHLRDAYDALDDKNMQLQRQIRQLEINLTLAKKEATAPVDRAAEKPYRDLLTELEAKMIRGATALTVEAVDAISGEDMSATYGYIAEQTLLLYQSTNRCLQTLHEMNGKYPPTTLENQRQFVSGVESAMQAMEKLTVNAQYLWSSIPALYRCPS
ncbi:hypothetical protein AGDE_13079 [Angomonas deanei]|uniref:Uncharacterized protein n=1 Tax=Angomonas deanei TaxID=59799 RepID=A0A7G2CFM6_9TRYP|nr:hypothetical protein AGDE_13079 [Angomonas deanei]CAD2218586.1 hypothetical protein, conserved [Angomonas deanei]|eukprot:EPY22768.1 hypothetical protein AGDE_13079 [Angomonas deanei]